MKKPLDRNTPSPRQPSGPPRHAGIHGGSIDRWSEYNSTPSDTEAVRAVDDSDPAPAQREAEPNALEAALQRTAPGRQALSLMAEIADRRIRGALCDELVRCARADVEQLERKLGGSDPVATAQVAAKLPGAKATLAKWNRARAAYEDERKRLEFTLADLARGLSL